MFHFNLFVNLYINYYYCFFSDEYTKIIITFLYDNPWTLKLASICIGVLVIVLATIKCMQSDEKEDKEDKED